MILFKFVAIHYRFVGKVHGCWKEFDTKDEAKNWLVYRQNKTPDSPKGGVIFDKGIPVENLESLVRDRKEQPFGLVSAVEAYLSNQQRIFEILNKLGVGGKKAD